MIKLSTAWKCYVNFTLQLVYHQQPSEIRLHGIENRYGYDPRPCQQSNFGLSISSH
jgi:hypothetical protein